LSPKVREAYLLKAEKYYAPLAIHISLVNEQCRLSISKSCVDNNHLCDATMIEFIAIAEAANSATAWVYELKFHKFLDLPPELRLNVYTHALFMVARYGYRTKTDSVGMIRTRYRIEITTTTSNYNLTKTMEVSSFYSSYGCFSQTSPSPSPTSRSPTYRYRDRCRIL
jgi:hypothetical protein